MWEKCKDIQQELVAMRRDLHKIPEFGGELPKTKAYIIDKLNEWGIISASDLKQKSSLAFLFCNYTSKMFHVKHSNQNVDKNR